MLIGLAMRARQYIVDLTPPILYPKVKTTCTCNVNAEAVCPGATEFDRVFD